MSTLKSVAAGDPLAGARLVDPLPLGFELDDEHVAHEPPEAGRVPTRDAVRMMVSRGEEPAVHARFSDLPQFLDPGDLLVVNTSATVAAAIDAHLVELDVPIVIHVSTELPGGLWMVEPRTRFAGGATEPLALPPGPHTALLADDTRVHLLRTAPESRRLWLAVTDGDLVATMACAGRAIRYRYVERDWPLDAYQTVFAAVPGSAEMPSAARPFTAELVTRLVRHGIGLATITLHTGVSSLEGHELPYPERYDVPAATAAMANAVHAVGGRVVAVGTTVVRALETAADARGVLHPMSGWTDAVITPTRGVRAVDGLVSGWHEPAATHLAMLEAVAGRPALMTAYREAWASGYRWHEFGDSHLLLPYAGDR